MKQFLVDYGQLKVLDRYIIIHDSISSFYDVLCTKMSHNDIGSTQGVELQMPQPGARVQLVLLIANFDCFSMSLQVSVLDTCCRFTSTDDRRNARLRESNTKSKD